MGTNLNTSLWSYQNLDGTNCLLLGATVSKNFDNGRLSTFAGIRTDHTKGGTGLVFDIKGSTPYGNTPLSGGFRIRHNITQDAKTVEFRAQPLDLNVPITDSVDAYLIPYSATKINYGTKDVNTKFGAFGGIKVKVKNVNLFGEAQLYDFTNVNPSTIGVNAGVSVTLNTKKSKKTTQ